jgi:YesN/AraC family two-component response regulator
MAGKILVLDSDPRFRAGIMAALECYNTLETSTLYEAAAILKAPNNVNLITIETSLPDSNGAETLQSIREITPHIPIIVLTKDSTEELAIEAIKNGVEDYIKKGASVEEIRNAVDRVFASKRGIPSEDAGDVRGKIEMVKRFTQKNYQKRVSLADIANVACLSPKYLSRVFKQLEGVEFTEYRLNIKMHKSKVFLRNTGCSIKQISHKVGYKNESSFTREFEKINGLSPTAYRRLYGRVGKIPRPQKRTPRKYPY